MTKYISDYRLELSHVNRKLDLKIPLHVNELFLAADILTYHAYLSLCVWTRWENWKTQSSIVAPDLIRQRKYGKAACKSTASANLPPFPSASVNRDSLTTLPSYQALIQSKAMSIISIYLENPITCCLITHWVWRLNPNRSGFDRVSRWYRWHLSRMIWTRQQSCLWRLKHMRDKRTNHIVCMRDFGRLQYARGFPLFARLVIIK